MSIVGAVKGLQGSDRSVETALQRLNVHQIAGGSVQAGQRADELSGGVDIGELPDDSDAPIGHKVEGVRNVTPVPTGRGTVTSAIRFPPILPLSTTRVLGSGEPGEHVLKSSDPGIGQQFRHSDQRRERIRRVDDGFVHRIDPAAGVNQVGVEQIGDDTDKFKGR